MRYYFFLILAIYSQVATAQKISFLDEIIYTKTFEESSDRTGIHLISEIHNSGHYIDEDWKKNFDGLSNDTYLINVTKDNVLLIDNTKRKILSYDSNYEIKHSLNHIVEEESVMSIGDNGFFGVSDWWESYGTYISVYSPNFKEVNQIIPYPNSGYVDIYKQNIEDKTFFLFTTDGSERLPKVIVISNETGKTTSTYNLPKTFNVVSNFYASEHYVAIHNFEELALINDSGKIIWSKKLGYSTSINFIIDEKDNRLYSYDNGTGFLSIYKLDNGELISSQDIIVARTIKRKAINQMLYNPEQKFIYLNFNHNRKSKDCHEFAIFDTKTRKISCSSNVYESLGRFKIIKLINNKNQFFLIGSTKTLLYEID